MNPGLAIVLILVALAGGVFLGYMLFFKKGVAAGVEQRKRDAEAIVGSAEQQAERIVEDAEKDADKYWTHEKYATYNGIENGNSDLYCPTV